MIKWHRGLSLPLLFLAIIAGCSKSGADRIVVSGAATYQGNPIQLGQIRFFPDANTSAPMAGTYIVDGKYVADAKGGVPVGTHRVEILAFRSKGQASQIEVLGGNQSEAKEQFLPAKYNAKTELTITLQPGSGPVTHDFELTN